MRINGGGLCCAISARFKGRYALLLIAFSVLTGCVTMSSVAIVAVFWIFMIPFLPLMIVAAPLYVLNASDTGVIGAKFSPDGAYMLTTYRDNAHTTLYKSTIDGDDIEAVTSGESFDYDPVYSPDGSMIAFCRRSRKRVSHLHLMNADGTNVRQITQGRREDFTPQFSSDGLRIVFSSYMLRKQADLFVVHVETGNELRLTDETGTHDVNPVFLPDDKTILFSRARWYGHYSPIASSDWHEYALYAIPVAGGDVQQLAGKERYGSSSIRLGEADDRRIVLYDGEYLAMDKRAFDSLSVKGAQYLQLRSLPSTLKNHKILDLSPDLTTVLALSREKGEAWDDVLIAVDLAENRSREIVRMDTAYSVRSAQFTPDGHHVVYRVAMKSRYGKTHEALWITSLDGDVRRLDTVFPGVPEWTLDEEESDGDGGERLIAGETTV